MYPDFSLGRRGVTLKTLEQDPPGPLRSSPHLLPLYFLSPFLEVGTIYLRPLSYVFLNSFPFPFLPL